MFWHTEAGTAVPCSAERGKISAVQLSSELPIVSVRADNVLETIPNTVA